MKIDNSTSIENIGFLLYMQEQENKKNNDNGQKADDRLEILRATPNTQ